MNLYHADTAARVAYCQAVQFVRRYYGTAPPEVQADVLVTLTAHMEAAIKAYASAAQEKLPIPIPSRNRP